MFITLCCCSYIVSVSDLAHKDINDVFCQLVASLPHSKFSRSNFYRYLANRGLVTHDSFLVRLWMLFNSKGNATAIGVTRIKNICLTNPGDYILVLRCVHTLLCCQNLLRQWRFSRVAHLNRRSIVRCI